MTDFYRQFITDTQGYITSQLQLMKVQSVEQASQLIGLIITLITITSIVIVGLIFFAIALAAWLEQWLPMWISYLVIAGAMLLIAIGFFWGRRIWFVRPIEKHLSEVIMDNPMPLKQQKQIAETKVAMQRGLFERDITEIHSKWKQIQHICSLLWDTLSPTKFN
jgi:magnesium-transporting ATPase (P-type)